MFLVQGVSSYAEPTGLV